MLLRRPRNGMSGRGYGRPMADFTDTDLRGSRFEGVDLSGSRFLDTDLAGASSARWT